MAPCVQKFIICGAAAHIRLNYRRSGLSAEIGGLWVRKRKHVFSVHALALSLSLSLSASPSLALYVTTHKGAHTLLRLDAISLEHGTHTQLGSK